MADALHLRPTGFLYGDAAKCARACDKAGALAGGAVAFTQVEVIEGPAGAATRRCLDYGNVAGSDDPGVQAILTRISAPRPPQAGLDMAGTLIMGVVNVTPDSFSDGGLYDEAGVAIAHAAQLALDGADIVDIGGESTRPGSDAVDRDEELRRVLPVLEGLKGGSAVISIDTRRADVMRAGLNAGAHIINDVSALTYDDAALATAAASEAPVILMHAQGDPKTMQKNPVYDDVVLDIYDYLDARIEAAEDAGIARERIIVDPGIGVRQDVRAQSGAARRNVDLSRSRDAHTAGCLAQEFYRQARRRARPAGAGTRIDCGRLKRRCPRGPDRAGA